jgi:hypothetical protein
VKSLRFGGHPRSLGEVPLAGRDGTKSGII